MPYGFEEHAEDGTQLVCFLLRALYGLKQSPLLWYEELTAFLRSISLELIQSDPYLFIDHISGSFIIIYVDDLLIFIKTVTVVNRLPILISKKFPLKELRDVLWFVGYRN
jgi:hypothetical protein